MLGIPREVAEHALHLILGSKPAKQRLCRFDDERRRAIGEEIAKLLAAGFIRGFDPDAKPAPGGSDPNAKPALGGSDPSTSMMMSPANVAVLALDQTDWRVPLLAYLLEEVLPPERTEA